MKKILKKVGTLLGYILLVPVTIVVGIGLLLYIPVDFVNYHCSAFYKDTKLKYELFAGNGHWFRLYNVMRAAELPLDFHLHTTDNGQYGYFRYKNILLVLDFPVEFDPKKQQWFVYDEEDDDQVCTTLEEALEISLEGFNEITGEKLCDRAVMLIDRTHIPEEDLSYLESCPHLLGYNGQKDMASAIKQWIGKNRG